MQLESRDFELNDFVRDAARFWSAPAAEKGLTLQVAGTEGDPVWLRGDPYRLRQVVNNLVSNAIKFTPSGTIRLEASAPADAGRHGLTLTVVDQGAGISPEAMSRLFSPFAQGSAEVARTYGGTGLGLTVSRELARLMREFDNRLQMKDAAKVNLIPFNPFPGTRYQRPDDSTIRRFQKLLNESGRIAPVRRTRGDDIDAACGQLKGQVADRTRRQAEHLKRLGEGGDGVDAAA